LRELKRAPRPPLAPKPDHFLKQVLMSAHFALIAK
jgi:hypothetical protein